MESSVYFHPFPSSPHSFSPPCRPKNVSRRSFPSLPAKEILVLAEITMPSRQPKKKNHLFPPNKIILPPLPVKKKSCRGLSCVIPSRHKEYFSPPPEISIFSRQENIFCWKLPFLPVKKVLISGVTVPSLPVKNYDLMLYHSIPSCRVFFFAANDQNCPIPSRHDFWVPRSALELPL